MHQHVDNGLNVDPRDGMGACCWIVAFAVIGVVAIGWAIWIAWTIH